MKLLRVLAENAGEVMTREELISAVWGVEYGGDESLSRGISILRKVLGDKRGDHRYIVTISRVGYRMVAEVDENYKPTQSKRFKPIPPETTETPTSPRDPQENKSKGSESLSSNPDKFEDKSFRMKTLIPAAVFVLAFVVILSFTLFGKNSFETLSLQARVEQGYSHIENFTPKGAIEDAQDIFSDILADNPNHAAARAGLAFALFREYTHLEHDPALLQRATSHAEAALRKDEHLALANIAVAWAAGFNGDLDRAHEYLDKADILASNHILAFEERYRTYRKQGYIDKCEETLNIAVETYPDHALFYADRGNYFDSIGNFSASESDFRKAIKLSPDSARIYAQLAQSLHSQSRTSEAVRIIQQGLNVNETALLYNNLGTYLFFQGQYNLAGSAFEKTIEIDGDSHSYLYWANLGDAYRWSNDKKDEAATSYRRALQLLQIDLSRYSEDTNLKSRAAMFNAKLGNLDKAREYMDSIVLTSNSPSIQLYRAVVTYEILSDRAEALEYLEAAIKSNYPMIEILNDPELAQLRQDPAYHKLLAKTQN